MPGMRLNPLFALDGLSPQTCKPVVVGIYAVPGSGKTTLINQLKQLLEQEPFVFYDGSEMIATVVPGGMSAFHKMKEADKMVWRTVAINKIRKDCVDQHKTAVVAGHFMLWADGEEVGREICTPSDLETYTHILYLDVPADVVAQRRLQDAERSRPLTTIDQVRKWQEEEKDGLLRLCRARRILLSFVPFRPTLLDDVSVLLRDFKNHSEKHNMHAAEIAMDNALAPGKGQLKTLLVLDADKTLAAEDTGALFWKCLRQSGKISDDSYPLKALFGSPLGYSYEAFRQATLLYEQSTNKQEYETMCREVASMVVMHPDFVSLLQLVSGHDHIRAVVVSCGLRRVWEIVLERAGLSETVKVIAGGRISNGYVVTAAVKAALVTRSQNVHKLFVWAFGDSVLDLDMLRNADRAIVVVGLEQTRSKTMDSALNDAIEHHGLRALQALLPNNASPRLNFSKLPLIQLTGADFIAEVIGPHTRHRDIRLLHASDRKAASLLMSPMRDATTSGPLLRESHRRVGYYLATELLAEVIGLEEYPIPHVQGHTTTGFRLLHEQRTMIVALMRGGEPMAFGVNDAFPLAMFFHARCPGDLKGELLEGKMTVILVDSVINSGKTIVQFVRHIRSLHASIRIVVVAGVIQAQCMSNGLDTLRKDTQLALVALRQSNNKFIGKGGTDTGNRLFHTTHLD